uniref:Polygalacturonase n=1 Tax=Manihot esculenta TaxID=3983 RepID=A0A2C9W1M0_MANES
MLGRVQEFLLILLVVALASWRPTTEASTADVMQHGAAGDGKTDDSKALTFSACNNLQLSGLSHVNSQSAHIHITSSNSVLVSNLYIIAPASSPNTDGIDISHSTDAWIHDSTIGTGDDCIAIGGDSSNIKITGVTCGPGHGISIGSLGHNGNTDIVEEVHVKDCILKRTTNGVRIKTWQGGSGYARKISFENITLDAVANPIIIDQFYCDHKFKCKNQTSAVKVSNVIYKGVHGTSITEDSIKLMCSQSISCSDIVLSDINIVSANSGKPTHAFCSNAYGTNSLSNPLVNCLSIPLTYEGCHPPENCLPPSQSTKFLDFHNVYLFFLSFLLCFSFLNPL